MRLVRSLLFPGVVWLALWPAGAGGQSVPPQDPAARAGERIAALQREAETLASQERTLLGELRKLEVERDLRLEESRRLDAEASAVRGRIDATSREMEATRLAIEAARPGLDARLVQVYKLGRPGYARMLLGTGRTEDSVRAARLAAALASLDHRRVAEQTSAISRLTASRVELEEQSARLKDLQAAARVAAGQSTRAAGARAQMVRRIDERRDLTAQMVGELEHARERLKMLVPGAPVESVALPLKPFRGTLDWPVSGQVLSRFGQSRNPRFGTTVSQSGIEIAAAESEGVRAVHEGRVVFADVFAGFGQLAIVDHGNLGYSLYGYLGSIAKLKGAAVAAGERLGTTGRSPSGNSALYFELRIDGKPVDPLQWLKRR
jgi:septal ring factor EnvC (AmiA/AmiB activator)